MKAEVYSWRVSTDLKTSLEHEARRRKTSLSAVLDLAAREWLDKAGAGSSEEEQQRLHEAALSSLGAFAGGNRRRSETVRLAVRQLLRKSHER
jgi:hypothetical protein